MGPIKAGTRIFVRVPGDPDERILIPTRVVGVEDEALELELERPTTEVPGGTRLLLYYEREGCFVQQPARAVQARSGAESARLGIVLVGDPSTSERRHETRHPTERAGVTARIGEGPVVPVRDVSESSFAVVSEQHLTAHEGVAAELHYAGRVYAGAVSTRSFVKLGSARFRYGLRVDPSEPGSLREGLRRVAADARGERAGSEGSPPAA